MSGALEVRHDWTVDEVVALHDAPLFELVDRARRVHRRFQPDGQVQLCTLLSVKTGGCMEDCSYCSQSKHHSTHVDPSKAMTVEEVLAAARRAKEHGATRLCMGAAGRGPGDGPWLERVAAMVRGVKQLGLETCCTLGLLTSDQAEQLQAAGLDVYNHNLDTSERFYDQIVHTHSYQDRLATLRAVRAAHIDVCCGGIVGMGESVRDRCALLVELGRFDPPVESVPLNALVPIPGTPLADRPPVRPIELIRLVATTRVVVPTAKVRLSAGRHTLTATEQLFCFYAGANSIFYGDELLTTPNAGEAADQQLLREAGLRPAPPRVG
ncbi:MAG: biotin synthase BioB [Deltaproteobacteria bacterium]|jgi:biotin synthase|nr:biotin synthase BioB [Deltaproteobacteria bacterium]MBW2534991.1 biotin synthase BioB [Deltaproteobacteria bacterium]